MKRVIHLSTVHIWNDTRIYYRECRSLKKAGYDVSLMAVVGNSKPQVDIEVIALPSIRNPYIRIFIAPFIVFFKLMRLKFEILHFHDPELIPLALIFRLMGKKIIFDIHENYRDGVLEKRWIFFPRFVKIFVDMFDKIATKWFYLVIAEHSYDLYYKHLTQNRQVVLNYPALKELAALRVERNYDKPRLFYQGSVSIERGAIVILKALDLLDQIGFDFEFDCVGDLDSYLVADLEFQLLKYRLKGKVRFHGRKDLLEGYKISQQANLGLSILLPIRNYVESYPTKIFEYMAIGMPMIASNFPLYKGIVEGEKCGVTADPENTVEIAQSIVDLFKNPKLLEEMGRRGPEIVHAKYSWESEERKLLEFYAKI